VFSPGDRIVRRISGSCTEPRSSAGSKIRSFRSSSGHLAREGGHPLAPHSKLFEFSQARPSPRTVATPTCRCSCSGPPDRRSRHPSASRRISGRKNPSPGRACGRRASRAFRDGFGIYRHGTPHGGTPPRRYWCKNHARERIPTGRLHDRAERQRTRLRRGSRGDGGRPHPARAASPGRSAWRAAGRGSSAAPAAGGKGWEERRIRPRLPEQPAQQPPVPILLLCELPQALLLLLHDLHLLLEQ